MALWGNKDNLTAGDFLPAAPSKVTVVGTASSDFWTAEAQSGTFIGVPTGTTMLLSADGSGDTPGTEGFLVIESLLADDLARCGKMSGVGTDVDEVFDVEYSEQPISLKNDPGFAESAANITTGISTIRTQVAAGIATAGIEAANEIGRGGFHAGWVGIMTYIDMHGNLRQKTETYVAASGIETGHRPFPAA